MRHDGVGRSQQPQQRLGAKQQDNTRSKRKRRSEPHRRCRHAPGALLIVRAEAAGNEAPATDAKQIGNRIEQHVYRERGGQSRHLSGIARLPDEPGIRHVVRQHHELACHGRQGEGCHGARDGRPFEKLGGIEPIASMAQEPPSGFPALPVSLADVSITDLHVRPLLLCHYGCLFLIDGITS